MNVLLKIPGIGYFLAICFLLLFIVAFIKSLFA